MGFADDLKRFRASTNGALEAVGSTAVFTAHKSITAGSVLTSAPGQPVKTGRLRNSWQIERLSKTLWRISTNIKYAPPIEDGISRGTAITFRSKVGGAHSLKLTVLSWPRIVEDSVARVARSPRFAGGADDGSA